MIVGRYFEGDEDTKTAWEQHDVYNSALHVIFDSCRRHVSSAIALLDLQWPKKWESNCIFDHRDLQITHDLLAACWRFRSNSIQPVLPFRGEVIGAEVRMRSWFTWLRSELAQWQQQPRLIVLIMNTLASQNPKLKDQTESERIHPARTLAADQAAAAWSC